MVKRARDDITLEVYLGEISGVLDPNGAHNL
jgi:ABC-type Na+ transport system ATPase subunit NatA